MLSSPVQLFCSDGLELCFDSSWGCQKASRYTALSISCMYCISASFCYRISPSLFLPIKCNDRLGKGEELLDRTPSQTLTLFMHWLCHPRLTLSAKYSMQ
jgi:hypothetical protein